MSAAAALNEADLAPLIARLRHDCGLFHGVDDHALRALLLRSAQRVHLVAGEDLIAEGDAANTVCFVEQGHFEVRKRGHGDAVLAGNGGDGGHRIGTLDAGAVVGEVALLDSGRRSATVRALGDAVALVLHLDGDGDGPDLAPATRMRLNLAREMAHRVRHTTDSTVLHLEASLREAQTRLEMSGFFSRVLIGTCLYMFASALLARWKALLPDTTLFSAVVLLGFALALILNIRASIYPASDYGFTLKNWRPALREATLWSLPVMALIVLLKWTLMRCSPSFARSQLFDFYRDSGMGLGARLAVAGAYALFVPLQEMIARSGIQSSFMMFLRSRHKVPLSIGMSTLLFSATHLHTSVMFALLVFPAGLFWGWLYARHPTLVGVVWSHLLIGLWAIFVVSFPFF